jgi:universal stress protein E
VASIRRILVAVRDPFARSQPEVRKAAQLARSLGARLELFHALTWPIFAPSREQFLALESGQLARIQARLQTLAQRLQRTHRLSELRVHASWDAPAAEAVIRRACATRTDLIIAGRHRGAHFPGPWLSMGDWELLRRSPLPVLLVKKPGHYRRRPVLLAAVDPNHALDKPARLDDAILSAGTAVSHALRGALHTVHASGEIPLLAPLPRSLNAEQAAARYQRLISDAEARYQKLLNRHRIGRSRRHLLHIPPADAIQQVAQRLHADIVVVGAVSRRGWQRLLLGSMAETLLDPLECDLLVIKPSGFKVQIPPVPTGPRLQLAVPATL